MTEADVERVAKAIKETANNHWSGFAFMEPNLAELLARAAIAAMPPPADKWQPIETAIGAAKSNDGWISQCLFGKLQPYGWATWVGQCDAGDVWLGVDENGSCWECEIPTHWMPLPEPPK